MPVSWHCPTGTSDGTGHRAGSRACRSRPSPDGSDAQRGSVLPLPTGLAGDEPGQQVVDRHRPGEVPALDDVAAEGHQPVPGRLVLDALRDDLEAEVAAQV